MKTDLGEQNKQIRILIDEIRRPDYYSEQQQTELFNRLYKIVHVYHEKVCYFFIKDHELTQVYLKHNSVCDNGGSLDKIITTNLSRDIILWTSELLKAIVYNDCHSVRKPIIDKFLAGKLTRLERTFFLVNRSLKSAIDTELEPYKQTYQFVKRHGKKVKQLKWPSRIDDSAIALATKRALQKSVYRGYNLDFNAVLTYDWSDMFRATRDEIEHLLDLQDRVLETVSEWHRGDFPKGLYKSEHHIWTTHSKFGCEQELIDYRLELESNANNKPISFVDRVFGRCGILYNRLRDAAKTPLYSIRCPECYNSSMIGKKEYDEGTDWRCYVCGEHLIVDDKTSLDFFNDPYALLHSGSRLEDTTTRLSSDKGYIDDDGVFYDYANDVVDESGPSGDIADFNNLQYQIFELFDSGKTVRQIAEILSIEEALVGQELETINDILYGDKVSFVESLINSPDFVDDVETIKERRAALTVSPDTHTRVSSSVLRERKE